MWKFTYAHLDLFSFWCCSVPCFFGICPAYSMLFADHMVFLPVYDHNVVWRVEIWLPVYDKYLRTAHASCLSLLYMTQEVRCGCDCHLSTHSWPYSVLKQLVLMHLPSHSYSWDTWYLVTVVQGTGIKVKKTKDTLVFSYMTYCCNLSVPLQMSVHQW